MGDKTVEDIFHIVWVVNKWLEQNPHEMMTYISLESIILLWNIINL